MRSLIYFKLMIFSSIFLVSANTKINQSNIALNILKIQLINLELNNYLKILDENKFINLKSSIKFLSKDVFSIDEKDIKLVIHKLGYNFKVFSLEYPVLDFQPLIIAVDNNGLFYYLNGFNTDHFNKLFSNRIIKYQCNENFARDLIDLYTKTMILKYDLYEELIINTLKVTIKNSKLNVSFDTKSQRTDERFNYKVEITENGLNLTSRTKIK